MKLSVIIPAHKAEQTLPRTLESLNAAAARWAAETHSPTTDVEVVVSWDREGRGPSWARNCGLEKATGDYVFFCDADDTVEVDFFLKPFRELERTGADICFFAYHGFPKISNFTLEGNNQIREAYLPAYFGYSNADIARWNQGGDLALLKEPGSVCRCAFRRPFLDAHTIRFDENMTLFEDAAFLSTCVVFAEKTVSLHDELYTYHSRAEGNMTTGWYSDRYWRGKFAALAFRKQLNEKTKGQVWRFCEASCALTALEMLRARRKELAAYLADQAVVSALRTFPISWRHPLVLMAIFYLRWRVR